MTIYSYGLMVALGFVLALFLIMSEARRQMINANLVFNLCYGIFICGVLGARAFYVLHHFGYYSKNPWEIFMFQHGGMSWFGGLFAGSFFGIAYLKSKRLSIPLFLDLLAPFVALAQAVGRIGCFLNGCCYGKPSPFGIYFPTHDKVLIPTQLYSAFALVLIFFALRFIQLRPHVKGQVFLSYLALYSTKRFLIEFLRDDTPPLFAGLTLFQFLSIAVFIFSVSMLFYIIGRRKK